MPSNPKDAYLARLEQEKQDRARIAQYVNERQSLDALIVAINDEFGFGAEIGISTQKLHARGPMGLEALTSTKYIIYGNGQVRK